MEKSQRNRISAGRKLWWIGVVEIHPKARGRELDGEAVKKSVIFSDWTQACHRDAGDILFNISIGELAEFPPMVEIGEVLSGKHPGRTDEKQITMFESVGISVEDIAAAKMIYEYAKENGIGTWLEI